MRVFACGGEYERLAGRRQWWWAGQGEIGRVGGSRVRGLTWASAQPVGLLGEAIVVAD